MCNQEAQRKKCFFLLGNKKCLEKTFMQMFHCKPIELIDQILMARVTALGGGRHGCHGICTVYETRWESGF